MKEQGIFSAFTFSLFMHVLLVVITGIIVRHSNSFRLPSPYVVSLVNVSNLSGSQGARIKDEAPAAAQETSPNVQHAIEKPTKQENEMVSDRISALRAKKRLERMVALRKMVDIGSHKNVSQGAQANAQGKGGKPGGVPGGGDYYSLVESRIRQQWVFPESIDRDLEAVISIRIAKDGSVTIDRMEKNSGNALFDRSVLRAIAKASPLPPPPQEMEMGVRFRP